MRAGDINLIEDAPLNGLQIYIDLTVHYSPNIRDNSLKVREEEGFSERNYHDKSCDQRGSTLI